VSWSAFNQAVCALRFLYGTTLGRPEILPRLPYGRRPKRIPRVLGRDEVRELLACTRQRQHRLVLTTDLKVLSRVFRGKLLALLRQANDQGELSWRDGLSHLGSPDGFARFLRPLYDREW